MTNCIATLAIGDGVLHPKSLESYQSAAERWGADLVVFREPLADCHFWWQKTFAIDHLLQYDHVLQIDADMLIAEDCPSPFTECDPGRLGVCRDLQHPSQYRLARWLSNHADDGPPTSACGNQAAASASTPGCYSTAPSNCFPGSVSGERSAGPTISPAGAWATSRSSASCA